MIWIHNRFLNGLGYLYKIVRQVVCMYIIVFRCVCGMRSKANGRRRTWFINFARQHNGWPNWHTVPLADSHKFRLNHHLVFLLLTIIVMIVVFVLHVIVVVVRLKMLGRNWWWCCKGSWNYRENNIPVRLITLFFKILIAYNIVSEVGIYLF